MNKERCFKCWIWFHEEDLNTFDNSSYPFCNKCLKELKGGKKE